MIKLNDRLTLSDTERLDWLRKNDSFLLAELTNLFGNKLFVRGIEYEDSYPYKMSCKFFTGHNELDYFIYSNIAVTKSAVKFVKKSRIGYYRPSKNYAGSFSRPAAFRFVRLRRQVLTNFQEEYYEADV
jgi:hypothetical protein